MRGRGWATTPSWGQFAQPIALARRPRGIVLAGALVDVHLRLRRRAPRGGGGGAVTVAELVDDL